MSHVRDCPTCTTRQTSAALTITVIFIIGTLSGACRMGSPTLDVRREAKSATTATLSTIDPRFVGSVIEPSSAEAADIRVDRFGQHLLVGDMRFAVDASRRSILVGTMWPHGAFNYDFAPDVRSDQFKVSQFRAACDQLTAESGVKCLDIQSGNVVGEENHVFVFNSDRLVNYSNVGRTGGRQPMAIISWNNRAIIAHEIKHALGWLHEHQRPDRDLFVAHFSENVIDTPDNHAQFEIVPPGVNKDSGPYDFESIMHYDMFELSKRPGVLKTLEPRPGHEDAARHMGQSDHLTATDISEIAKVYGPAGTEWCGLIPMPRGGAPNGCFFECQRSGGDRGQWLLCGSCAGARICP